MRSILPRYWQSVTPATLDETSAATASLYSRDRNLDEMKFFVSSKGDSVICSSEAYGEIASLGEFNINLIVICDLSPFSVFQNLFS